MLEPGTVPAPAPVVEAPAEEETVKACPVMSPDEPSPVSAPPVVASAAALRDATYGITGMTCASCSAVVEKIVGRLPGVASANVNLAV